MEKTKRIKEIIISGATARRLEKRGIITSRHEEDLEIIDDTYIFPSYKSFGNLEKGIKIYNNSQGQFFCDKGDDSCPIKLGKILRGLDPQISDLEIEKKVKIWQSYYIEPDVEVMDDVEEVYNLPHSPSGTIRTSCMRSKGKYYSYLKRDLEESLKVAVIKEGDELVARALLWYDVEDSECNQYNVLDRIYYSKEKYLEVLKKWASNNNFYHKLEQTYTNCEEFVAPTGEIVELNLKIPHYVDVNEYYPFLDTFRWSDGEYLYNNNDDGCYQYEFSSTSGDIEGVEQYTCDCCGRDCSSDELRYIEATSEDVCEDCLVEYYRWVESEGAYYPEGDVVYDDFLDEYLLTEDHFLVEFCYDKRFYNIAESTAIENLPELFKEAMWGSDNEVSVLEILEEVSDDTIFGNDWEDCAYAVSRNTTAISRWAFEKLEEIYEEAERLVKGNYCSSGGELEDFRYWLDSLKVSD